VQQERLDVGAEIGDQERRPVRHKAADEMHVTREPVEWRRRSGTPFRWAGASQGGGGVEPTPNGLARDC
jgi:hypothetical protein